MKEEDLKPVYFVSEAFLSSIPDIAFCAAIRPALKGGTETCRASRDATVSPRGRQTGSLIDGTSADPGKAIVENHSRARRPVINLPVDIVDISIRELCLYVHLAVRSRRPA